jgi:hypothetical protein
MSSDRTRTRERSGTADGSAPEFEVGLDEPDDRSADAGTSGGLRERVGGRAKRLFSPRAFVAALLLTVVGFVLFNTVIPVLPGAGLPGIFVAAFLFGLVSERSRYLETTVAGGATAGVGALAQFAVVAAFGGFGVPLAAVAAGVGGLAGAIGNYFGRDLRKGLTRDVE